MTSTTDTAEHPEVSELSDLTEGLLSPTRTTDLRRHLSGCEMCADVHASLLEIRDLLGTLPGPPRMPNEIAGRIDAALAAEALLNATAPEAQDGDRETEPRVSRETAPAAAGADGPPDRPAGHPRAATGPGRTPSGGRRRRRRIAAAAFGAVATVAAIGLGALLVQPGGGSTTATDAGAREVPGAAASPDFSEAGLDDQVASLLSENDTPGKGRTDSDRGSTKPSFSAESTPESPHTKLKESAPQIPQCVSNGIDRTETPLAAEQGSYKGTRAYLVVLPHATDDSRVSAYVVDSSCVEKAPKGKGEVLLTQSYARR